MDSYVAGPYPVAITKEKKRTPPPIEAKWIGQKLIAVKTPAKKWKTQKIEPYSPKTFKG